MNAHQKWRNAIRDSELDSVAKIVALVLDTYANGSGEAWPARATLASGCSCSIDTVDRALVRLEQSGFVNVRRSRGRLPNTYTATFPTAAPERPLTAAQVRPLGKTNSRTEPANSRTGAARTRSTELENLVPVGIELGRANANAYRPFVDPFEDSAERDRMIELADA